MGWFSVFLWLSIVLISTMALMHLAAFSLFGPNFSQAFHIFMSVTLIIAIICVLVLSELVLNDVHKTLDKTVNKKTL